MSEPLLCLAPHRFGRLIVRGVRLHGARLNWTTVQMEWTGRILGRDPDLEPGCKGEFCKECGKVTEYRFVACTINQEVA